MYLDHDRREGEYVSFLAVILFDQHLWRGPPQGEAILIRSAPYGIRVSGDPNVAKTRDGCMTVFHEDVGLVGCQRGVTGSGRSRTTLRSPWITLQEWR